MTNNFEDIQKLGNEQLDAATTVAASIARGLQTIAAEASDFSKQSMEANSAYLEKLLNAKSLEAAMEIQSEFAKSNYERLVAQATKMGELYTALAKDAFKPVETALTRLQAVTGAKPPAAE